MANTILSSNHHQRVVHALVILGLLFLIQEGGAYEFKVGGSKGWTVPSDPNDLHYNQWAERNRFQIGDSLLFVYPPESDSVLLVNMEAYTNCSTSTYLQKFTDGHTVFTFNYTGPHYFISGVEDHCLKNEKMVVVVLADRSNKSSSTNQTSVASPPPAEVVPAPAPTEVVPTPEPSIASPPPAPSGEESPSPPTGSVEIIPSPAPTAEHAPPSGASAIVLSIISSIGALAGSSLLLTF